MTVRVFQILTLPRLQLTLQGWVSTLSRNTSSHQVFSSTSFCEYSSLWNAKYRFDLNEQRKLKERWQITFHELLKAPQNMIFFKKIIKINNNSNLPSKLCFSANIQFSDTICLKGLLKFTRYSSTCAHCIATELIKKTSASKQIM